MPRMIPTPISPATKSDAERMLYDALRDALDDDFIVFHGVAWQGVGADGRPRSGQRFWASAVAAWSARSTATRRCSALG